MKEAAEDLATFNMSDIRRYDLTPTMREINKKFSVRYYLNLVLVDEEDRRYFKQQVINK